MGGHEEHRHCGEVLSYRRREPQAVHARHLHVGQDERDRYGGEEPESVEPVGRLQDAMASVPQDARCEAANARLVVYYEDGRRL